MDGSRGNVKMKRDGTEESISSEDRRANRDAEKRRPAPWKAIFRAIGRRMGLAASLPGKALCDSRRHRYLKFFSLIGFHHE